MLTLYPSRYKREGTEIIQTNKSPKIAKIQRNKSVVFTNIQTNKF